MNDLNITLDDISFIFSKDNEVFCGIEIKKLKVQKNNEVSGSIIGVKYRPFPDVY